jgi:hypothetical protein
MFEVGARAAVFLLALSFAACTAVTPSPRGEPEVPSATPGATHPEEAALAELCDPQHDSSLARMAQELEVSSAPEDIERLEMPLQRARANLEVLSLGPDGMAIRDSAVEHINSLEAGIDDAESRRAEIVVTIQLLREMNTHACAATDR